MLCDICGEQIKETGTIMKKGRYYLPKVGLYLENVLVNHENHVIQGWVINGAWMLKRDGDNWLALDSQRRTRNAWSYEPYDFEKIADTLEEAVDEHEDDIPF